MKENKEHSGTFSSLGLALTWFALICLTGITVWVAQNGPEQYGVVLNIFIASLKTGLVLFVFMHLKYESLLLKLMLLLIVITLTAIMGLTFIDVLYR